MASWVQQILEANPELAAFPVVKRARRSLHLRRPDGKILGLFTGAPCHYQNEHGEWRPLDTTPLHDAERGLWYCLGLDVSITNVGMVHLGGYSQHTRRIGLFRPSARSFLATRNIPLGNRENDRFVAECDEWRIERRITPTGYRELLILKVRPDIPAAQAGDFLVLETLIDSVSLPNGWVESQYDVSAHWSPLPTAWDDDNKPLTCRRYWRDGTLYTGIPVTELAHAAYPVVIDPDFTSSTADSDVRGAHAVYATARATAAAHYPDETELGIGQAYAGAIYYVYRLFLVFDTSSIPDTATINQVNLTLTVTFWANPSQTFDIQIVKQDWSAQNPITAANREAAYDNCLAGTQDDNIWRSSAGTVVNTSYTSGDLSTAWPSKTGNTYYSLRSSLDVAGTLPTGYGAAGSAVGVALAEHATSAYRPTLTILYTAQNQQSVEGTLTSEGVLLKKTGLPKVAAISFTGLSTRTMKFARSILVGVMTLAGIVSRKVSLGPTTTAGELIPAGVVLGKCEKVLSGILTSAGAIVRKILAVRIGSLTFSGELLSNIRKVLLLIGTLANTGILVKKTQGAFAGILSSSGILVSKAEKVLIGTLTSAGAIWRKILKITTGELTFIGIVTKAITTSPLAGILTLAGTALKKTPKFLSGFIPFEGISTRTRRFARTVFTGVLSFVGVATSERPEKIGFITVTETLLYTITISELGDE